MRFTDKQLRMLIIPLVIEQLLAITVGLADSIMVASVGEAAVSGVSLVDNIMILIINVFAALATGGAVVSGQYIGQKREERACKAADQMVLFVTVLSIVITIGIYACQNLILYGVFGKIERDVFENARIYLLIVTASVPFIALYNGGTAIFRAMGDSNTPMKISVFMNGINLAGNAVLIYGMGMGTEGAAIPTTVSRIAGAAVILGMLKNQKYQVHLSANMEWRFDRHMIRRILYIGIPNGLENSMFQLGKILVLSLVATFGTASIAANAVANTVAVFQCLPGSAMGMAMLTVVSQCVGARRYDEVRFYTRKLMRMIYVFMALVNVFMLLVLPLILHVYQLSDETARMAREILIYHGCCAVTIWPLSFSLPNTLRAANDVKFPMWVSIISMWVCRVILSYVIGQFLGWGVFGIWVAMTIDWLLRAVLFSIRYRKGTWQLQNG